MEEDASTHCPLDLPHVVVLSAGLPCHLGALLTSVPIVFVVVRWCAPGNAVPPDIARVDAASTELDDSVASQGIRPSRHQWSGPLGM